VIENERVKVFSNLSSFFRTMAFNRRMSNNTSRNMKHNRLKIVVTAKNQTQYFLGDGFWFGRIGKAKFDEKLAAGCTIWETINRLPENVVQFA
jgi:hypothetical protein